MADWKYLASSQCQHLATAGEYGPVSHLELVCLLPIKLGVLFQLFDTWFLLINLLIMYICVIIAEFTKDPASPSIFPWATSLQHEQVRAASDRTVTNGLPNRFCD